MSKSKSLLLEPTPIFITLIGSTSVGKSCYLFSLGLTISNYPSINSDWVVYEISSDYKEQIGIWKQQYLESGVLGATDLGENIQLSFVIKNKNNHRQYKIIIADMAGEEIVRYLNNESVYKRIANDIKMRIQLSSGILLMVNSDKLNDVKEMNAWEQLLTTGIFSSLDICLMKADLLPAVKEKLQSIHEIVALESNLQHRLLYDQNLQESAQQNFFATRMIKLVNYMENHDIEARYHYISALGFEADKTLNHFDEFVSYNIFKPVIDILDHVEKNFRKGILAFLISKWKHFYWNTTLKKAQNTYTVKRYREAIEIICNKTLLQDVKKYHSFLHKFNNILKEIHSKWLKDRKQYQELSPESNAENLVQKIHYFYREVSDHKELDFEINKYKQNLINHSKNIVPKNDEVDYSDYVNFMHSQWKTIIKNISEYESSEVKTVLKNLEDFFTQLISQQMDSLKQTSLETALINKLDISDLVIIAKSVSFYIAIWHTSEEIWRKLSKDTFGDLADIRNRINYILLHTTSFVNSSFCYSTGFNIITSMQNVSQKMGSLINIKQKYFIKKKQEIAKERLTFFKRLRSVSQIQKKLTAICYDDDVFAILHKEWDFWCSQDNFPPPKNLFNYFPLNLFICPSCQGNKSVMKLCKCYNSFWLLRLLRISVEPCNKCGGAGEIYIKCNHCNGKKTRSFYKENIG